MKTSISELKKWEACEDAIKLLHELGIIDEFDTDDVKEKISNDWQYCFVCYAGCYWSDERKKFL